MRNITKMAKPPGAVTGLLALGVERLKRQLIRTPLEQPVQRIREMLVMPRRWRHPELRAVHNEDRAINQVLARVIRPRSRCLDIGAHYGSVLSVILRLAPGANHVAVEAVPEKAAHLRQKFPEVDVHACALSTKPGTIEFFVNLDRPGFSSLARREDDANDRHRRIEVPCRTLDELTQDAGPFDFVKIDVEGAEELVLRGGGRFLSQQRPEILIECGPYAAQAFGLEPVGVFDALTEFGYDLFFLQGWLDGNDRVTRDQFANALVYPFEAFNWLAQPKQRIPADRS